MKPDPTSAQIRATLASLKEADGCTYAALARMIRRPAAYVSRFVRDGQPDRLRDEEIRLLAAYFRCDPHDLGLRAEARA